MWDPNFIVAGWSIRRDSGYHYLAWRENGFILLYWSIPSSHVPPTPKLYSWILLSWAVALLVDCFLASITHRDRITNTSTAQTEAVVHVPVIPACEMCKQNGQKFLSLIASWRLALATWDPVTPWHLSSCSCVTKGKVWTLSEELKVDIYSKFSVSNPYTAYRNDIFQGMSSGVRGWQPTLLISVIRWPSLSTLQRFRMCVCMLKGSEVNFRCCSSWQNLLLETHPYLPSAGLIRSNHDHFLQLCCMASGLSSGLQAWEASAFADRAIAPALPQLSNYYVPASPETPVSATFPFQAMQNEVCWLGWAMFVRTHGSGNCHSWCDKKQELRAPFSLAPGLFVSPHAVATQSHMCTACWAA